MLFYLTSEENIGLFDFLTEESNMFIKKMSGTYSLNTFTKYNLDTLPSYRYLAIDLSIIEEELEEIVSNILGIKTLFDIRIILLADELKASDLKHIVEKTSIYNIITESSIKDLQDEIRICTSPGGMTREYIYKKISSNFGLDLEIEFEEEDKYNFSKENIKIVIMGTMRRTGTTTVAINLAKFLSNLGSKVSYTEANDHNHLQHIKDEYYSNNVIKKGYFTDKNMDYYFNKKIPTEGYDFNIIDLGEINEFSMKVFKQIGDIKILSSGIKAYELPELKSTLKNLGHLNYNLLLQEGDMIDLNKILFEYDNLKYFKIKYTSSLFEGDTNKNIWDEILSEFMVKSNFKIA